MIRMLIVFLTLAAPLAAQTPPQAGGRQPDHPGTRDVGPAIQPPRTEGPQAINRGTDGAAIQAQPGGTGITPQGMMGTATAGERNPNAPIGGAPPQSSSIAEEPVVGPTPQPTPTR